MSGRAASDTVIPGRAAISVGNPNTALPPGWAWTPLTAIAELGSGHTPSRKHPEYWGGDVPWIGIRDAGAHHGGVIYDTLQRINQLGLSNSSARLLPKGTICLSRTASVGYVVRMGRDMATSQDFVAWSCTAALEPDFLMQALLAEGADIRRFGEGSTHTTIYFPEVKAFHIALPPLGEQRRIVAKIDSLTGKSRRARDHLDHLPRLVEKYKQAVLAAAFRGDFTRGTTSASHKSLGSLTSRITKGASPNWQGFDYQEEGVLFVRSQNVGWGEMLLKEKVFLPAAFNQKQKNSVISENDVLLNIVGASIGRSAIATAETEGANCNQAVSVIRLAQPSYSDARYLNLWFQSDTAQNAITLGSVDFARANFSLASIRELCLPWPNETVRLETVRRIETAFAWIDRLASEATSARKLIDRLDQTALAKAFRGELVPQDPDDEPASVLLERIRAERGAVPKTKGGRKMTAA